jgi:hypothetical protein
MPAIVWWLAGPRTSLRESMHTTHCCVVVMDRVGNLVLSDAESFVG